MSDPMFILYYIFIVDGVFFMILPAAQLWLHWWFIW